MTVVFWPIGLTFIELTSRLLSETMFFSHSLKGLVQVFFLLAFIQYFLSSFDSIQDGEGKKISPSSFPL